MYKKYSGIMLEKTTQKRLIIVYSYDEEHEVIILAELSYHDNPDQFDKATANEADDSSEVDVAQENLFE